MTLLLSNPEWSRNGIQPRTATSGQIWYSQIVILRYGGFVGTVMSGRNSLMGEVNVLIVLGRSKTKRQGRLF
jgi:hypothetical protein